MAENQDPAAALPDVVAGVNDFAKAALSGEIYVDELAMQTIVSQFRRVKDEIDAMVVDDQEGYSQPVTSDGGPPCGVASRTRRSWAGGDL